ncbi:hypothetical protein [Phocaeicola plebeius]|jgi:hypothetical protein|uniref:hypothetical protein n=1 Tax=Phocaeicola plebeius TaxID=310297 RepID=UPI003F95BDA2
MNNNILILGLLSLALGASGCRNTGKHTSPQLRSIGLAVPKAARITIDRLPEILKNVQAGRTQLDFTGICGNGTDCIYFMQENGKFYIDFEAMSKEQLPYLDSLKQFAKEHGYPIVETTYNNTPVDYDHLQYAPVLSLKINADIDSIVKVGKQIEHTIFRNNDRTVYEIVP